MEPCWTPLQKDIIQRVYKENVGKISVSEIDKIVADKTGKSFFASRGKRIQLGLSYKSPRKLKEIERRKQREQKANEEQEKLNKVFAKNIMKRRLENEDLSDEQYILKLEWLVEQYRDAWEKEKRKNEGHLCIPIKGGDLDG